MPPGWPSLTGLNVIDAFPARDLAQGGLGGPLIALPEWLLLRHRDRSRVLLDLGRTVRVDLPAGRIHRSRRRADPRLRGRAGHGLARPAGPAALRRRSTPSIRVAAWPPKAPPGRR